MLAGVVKRSDIENAGYQVKPGKVGSDPTICRRGFPFRPAAICDHHAEFMTDF